MRVAFTGHRPDKLGGYKNKVMQYRIMFELSTRLGRAFRKGEEITAISGMAQGVDQWAALVCVALGIPWEAAVPCDGQEAPWPAESRGLYHALLKCASKVTVVSPGPYEAWKMQRRNEWMVDNCDRLIAIWDGSAGGTGNCVAYAQKVGTPVHVINPFNFKWAYE
jgi:uncharacterized phage-like protein YoqJ